MSDAQATSQKQITILLALIAVLLAAVVGVLLWQSNRVPDPSPTQATNTQSQNTGTSTTGTSTAAASTAEFDPATAPTVPADQTPEQYVTAYYQACESGDYEKAFTMLPTATATNYGDAASFASQLEGYGLSGFEVEPQVEVDASTITVQGYQSAQGMSFGYTWTFKLGDDGTWLAASRDMAGMK